MGIPLIDNLWGILAYYPALVVLSFLLVYPGGKRLPPDAPMGLVMSLFIPAFAHLYVYKARSLLYVAGLLVLGWGVQAVAGWWPSLLATTALSFGLMYRRLVVLGEGAPPENPSLHAVAVRLDAPTLARLNDLMDASGESRDAVVARALAAMPLEE